MKNKHVREFDQSRTGLTAQDRRQLIERLKRSTQSDAEAQGSDVSVFGLLNEAGIVGCIKGDVWAPTDLRTNPRHMEGFGRDGIIDDG